MWRCCRPNSHCCSVIVREENVAPAIGAVARVKVSLFHRPAVSSCRRRGDEAAPTGGGLHPILSETARPVIEVDSWQGAISVGTSLEILL